MFVMLRDWRFKRERPGRRFSAAPAALTCTAVGHRLCTSVRLMFRSQNYSFRMVATASWLKAVSLAVERPLARTASAPMRSMHLKDFRLVTFTNLGLKPATSSERRIGKLQLA